jgi:hypothetical protein
MLKLALNGQKVTNYDLFNPFNPKLMGKNTLRTGNNRS